MLAWLRLLILRVLRRAPRPQVEYVADYTALPWLCSGQQTGFQCKHYWPAVWGEAHVKTHDNSERVRVQRLCIITGDGDDLGNGGRGQAKYCAKYEWSSRPYDKAFEEAKLKDHAGTASARSSVPTDASHEQQIDDMQGSRIDAMKQRVKAQLAQVAQEESAANPPSDPTVTITKIVDIQSEVHVAPSVPVSPDPSPPEEPKWPTKTSTKKSSPTS